ncbi:hypothetical protein LO762_24830 [Actinocorallia sp. API 0066]|nr:hypothetical protein [Actinocorallia sp. API 0066]MCD0452389.1 hypothetical protein [Actinocorallia sp. API 0066]
MWRHTRLTLLSGESGVGKSHLVERAARSLKDALPVGRVTHRPAFPMTVLPPQNPFVFPLLSCWFPDVPPTRLADADLTGFLRAATGAGPYRESAPVLLCVDQAEPLFQPSPHEPANREAERAAFRALLGRTLTDLPHLRLLLVVRDTHLDEAKAFAETAAPGVSTGALTVRRLTPADAAAATAGDDAAAPVVGAVVEELCTVRRGDGHRVRTSSFDPGLFQAAYRAVAERAAAHDPRFDPAAEVDAALALHLTQTLNLVADDHAWISRIELERGFRAVFVDQTAPGPLDDRWTSVLRALEDRGLLTSVRDAGGTGYTLRHRKLVDAARAPSGGLVPLIRPTGEARLRESAAALWHGDHALARAHAESVARAHAETHDPAEPGARRTGGEEPDPVVGAHALCLLGDITHARGTADGSADSLARGAHEAVACYERAALILTAAGNAPLVAYLLAAIGLLTLPEDPVSALHKLHSAAARVPGDTFIQSTLTRALTRTNSPKG